MEDGYQLITELKSKIKELKQKNNNLESSLLIKNTLIDNLPNLFILIDTDGNILCLNEGMAKSLRNKKNLIGKNILEYFPPKVADFRTKMANKIIISKKPIIFEDKREDIWFKTKLFPILDSNGNVIQIATMVEEITEQKNQQQESEEKFRMLTDQSLMGLGIIQEGKIVYANDAITQITGYSKDEMYKKGTKILTKIIPPEYLLFVQEQLQKKLAGDKNVINRYPCEIISKTGELKWVDIFSKTIKYEGKNADFITFIDITDAKKAELAVKTSEEKWRSLVDNAPDIITHIDSKGIIRYVNHLPKDKKLKKFNPIGKKVIDLIPKEYHKLVNDTYNRVLKTGKSEQFEVRGLISGRWLNTHVGAIFDNRNPIGLTTITRDITEQKKADYEILKGKNYLQNIIDSTSEIIITINPNHEIKTWNKSAEKIIGYNKKDIINKDVRKIGLFEYKSEINNFMDSIINKKPINLREINIKTAYDTEITLSISPSIIKDELDNIKEIILICKDITQQRDIRKKLHQGHSYILDDISIENAIKIFYDIIEDKKGIYIGRQLDEKVLRYKKPKNIQIFKLSSKKDDEFFSIDNLENLERIIEKNIKKQQIIILLDRIDFLISIFTFEEIVKSFYKINDLVKKYNSILIIRINSQFLNEKQLSILYEEFEKLQIEEITDIYLRDDLFEILQYVNNENNLNINVTYGNIGKMFNISKVTVKKRIDSLIKNDLLYSRKIGKTKLLFLTDLGKKLLLNKS
jgi:PAS domain S-box-containing protein